MKQLSYTPALRQQWDAAVAESRNGTFLFRRSYMDYHRDRFVDASLLWTDDSDRVLGILPACRDGKDGIASHGGLTYGGLLLTPRATLVTAGEMLRGAMDEYAATGARQLIIKPIPYIYSTRPCEEELYWIFRLGGKLLTRSASQAIALQQDGWAFSTLRRRGVKRARRCGIHISTTNDKLEKFWRILEETLAIHHAVRPVHTFEEMEKLTTDNESDIRLFTAELEANVLAGTVVYECGKVAHTQYLATDDTGRATGSLDFLIDYVADYYKKRGFEWLDFGISTEKGGTILNEGLTFQKEGFGGRTICYDSYVLPLDHSAPNI